MAQTKAGAGPPPRSGGGGGGGGGGGRSGWPRSPLRADPGSCRLSLCLALPALVLKDRERTPGAGGAGGRPPESRPGSHARKLGPAGAWVQGEKLAAPEWDPSACPGSFLPLPPLSKELAPEFRSVEVFHHGPDSPVETL